MCQYSAGKSSIAVFLFKDKAETVVINLNLVVAVVIAVQDAFLVWCFTCVHDDVEARLLRPMAQMLVLESEWLVEKP